MCNKDFEASETAFELQVSFSNDENLDSLIGKNRSSFSGSGLDIAVCHQVGLIIISGQLVVKHKDDMERYGISILLRLKT